MYKMQFLEMLLIFTIPTLLVTMVFYNFGYILIAQLLVIVLSGACFFALLVWFYSILTYSKKVFYNPIIRMVEIHIGRKSSPAKLAVTVSRCIRLARKMNTNVLFYTNHYSEKELQDRYGGRVVIFKASILQTILFNLQFGFITFGLKKGERFPLLRCEIICS